MTGDLRSLYQEIIVDHNRRPRNFREIPDADRTANGDNPLCGDRLTVYVKVQGGMIRDIGFVGNGCAISTASASAMTDAVAGQSVAEALALQGRMLAVLTGVDEDPAHLDELGELAAFAGVRNYPMRVKCATLAWHALREALAGNGVRAASE